MLRPLSGRLLCEIAAPRRERPAAAADAATLVRAQVELPAAAVELTRRQYSAVLLLASYASRHRHLARRVRFGARRPAASVTADARSWWQYAAHVARSEWGARRAPLTAALLRHRREYLGAYTLALVADAGGAPLPAPAHALLESLEQSTLGVEQVLAFRALAAAAAAPQLRELQRRQEEARRERQRKRQRAAERDERRRRKEAEKAEERRRKERQREERRREAEERRREREAARARGVGFFGSLLAGREAREAEAAAEAEAAEAEAAAAAEADTTDLAESSGVTDSSGAPSGKLPDSLPLTRQNSFPDADAEAEAARSRPPPLASLPSAEARAIGAVRCQACWRRYVRRVVRARVFAECDLEARACAATRRVVRAHADGVLREAARADELFQIGLQLNREGHTARACEMIQRSALRRPRVNVLLSAANMRLKLGQPAAALLVYEHVLACAAAAAAAPPADADAAEAEGEGEEVEVNLQVETEGEAEEVTPEAPMSPPVAHRRAASFGASFDAGDGAAPTARHVEMAVRKRREARTLLLQRTPEEAAAGDGPDDNNEQRARRMTAGWLNWLGRDADGADGAAGNDTPAANFGRRSPAAGSGLSDDELALLEALLADQPPPPPPTAAAAAPPASPARRPPAARGRAVAVDGRRVGRRRRGAAATRREAAARQRDVATRRGDADRPRRLPGAAGVVSRARVGRRRRAAAERHDYGRVRLTRRPRTLPSCWRLRPPHARARRRADGSALDPAAPVGRRRPPSLAVVETLGGAWLVGHARQRARADNGRRPSSPAAGAGRAAARLAAAARRRRRPRRRLAQTPRRARRTRSCREERSTVRGHERRRRVGAGRSDAAGGGSIERRRTHRGAERGGGGGGVVVAVARVEGRRPRSGARGAAAGVVALPR